MLGKRKKYENNYWGAEPTYVYNNSKPKRSVKRKLAIVFSFIFILAVTPALIMTASNFEINRGEKVSVVNDTNSIQSTSKSYPVTIEEPQKPQSIKDVNQVEVINNDSYWKISKRACGTGKYYISIQSQNGAKALYKGDIVIANCTL